jgi:hypothetical protein
MESGTHFVACTGHHFQMFRLGNMELIQTYPGTVSPVCYPMYAAFAEDSKFLVTGTANGCAVIYETGSGKLAQTLAYPRNRDSALVQHVDVRFSLSFFINLL